jgi:hypothetical protein
MGRVEQWTLIVCGLLLIYPAPAADLVGLAGIALILGLQYLGRRTARTAAGP